MALWVEHLRKDIAAYDSFIHELMRHRQDAVDRIERAESWEEVLEARGAKKVLDLLHHIATLRQREEIAHGRYKQQARGN